MFPIRDTIPSRGRPWVTWLIINLNILAFFWELKQGPQVDVLLYRFGIVPNAWVSMGRDGLLSWLAQASTLVTSQFLHGGLLHLGSNMLYLWIFGDNVEDRLGHMPFASLYLLSGAVAGVAQLWMQPQSSLPMIGASGAIAGVLGAYFLLFPHARIVTLVPMIIIWKFVELPAFLFLGLWFALQWLQGLPTIGQVGDIGGVAWWAHVGGFATGLLLVILLRLRRRYA